MVQALLENERKYDINISIGLFNTIHGYKIASLKMVWIKQ